MKRLVYVYNTHYKKGQSRHGGVTLPNGCVNSPLAYLTSQGIGYCPHIGEGKNSAACKADALKQHRACEDQYDHHCATCDLGDSDV